MSEGAVLVMSNAARLATTRARIVSGSDAVLAWRDRLVELSRRCGQPGAMDQLEYYLARPVFARKRPTLILTLREADSSGEGETLESAVLLYEYQIRGVGVRWFSADYHGGTRTVIAPEPARRQVAFDAISALLREGALIVHVSYEGTELPEDAGGPHLPAGGHRPRWAAALREMVGYLPLQKTVDATLANLGKTTRRNLRYYRRRAEAALHHSLVESPSLTCEELIAFNRICTYPVPDEQVIWRYRAIERMPAGSLFLGLRAANGEWLSLIGGRVHEGGTDVEWQMNRGDMPSYSLGTVMRQHLIEREVQRGSKRIYFVGGTTHSIRSALVAHRIVDLVALRYDLPRWMTRRMARPGEEQTSFVGQLLSRGSLEWRPW